MNWKEIYTKIFLNQLDISTSPENVKNYMPLWWKNTRVKDSGGLRLTDEGFRVLNKIDLKVYEIPFPKDMPVTTQVIIFLDKFIDCPYYIGDGHVAVTNEKKAVELSLFSGDIRKYGLIKAMNKKKA